MAAELLAHRREQLVGEVGLAARAQAFEEGGAEHSGRSADVDDGEHRPAALARVSALTVSCAYASKLQLWELYALA